MSTYVLTPTSNEDPDLLTRRPGREGKETSSPRGHRTTNGVVTGTRPVCTHVSRRLRHDGKGGVSVGDREPYQTLSCP